jgi:hypothetical protein
MWTATKLWVPRDNFRSHVNSHEDLGSKGQGLSQMNSHETLGSRGQLSASCEQPWKFMVSATGVSSCEHSNRLCGLRGKCLLHVNSHETVGCTGQVFASCEQSNNSLGFNGRFIVCFMWTIMEPWGFKRQVSASCEQNYQLLGLRPVYIMWRVMKLWGLWGKCLHHMNTVMELWGLPKASNWCLRYCEV